VGARFSATVQTGPGAHPASYTVGTEYFLGVKRPGRGVYHPPHLTALLHFWACSRVNFTFTFTFTFYCYEYLVSPILNMDEHIVSMKIPSQFLIWTKL
jgi:hypothetical protein